MDRDDVVGAKAAAQYFIELYPYVYATGDLDEWRAMSHPECEFCASVIENVGELHEGGGYGVGGALDIVTIDAAPPADDYQFFSVWMDAAEEPSSHHTHDGARLRSSEGGEVGFDFALAMSADGWQVRGVVTLEEDEL